MTILATKTKINTAVYFMVILLLTGMCSCNHSSDNTGHEKSLGEIAKEESCIPIRPGKPGEQPFWNTYARRFIYAPAFDYPLVNGAAQYRYKIYSESDSSIYSFEDKEPFVPLSPVWAKIPVGYFDLKVIGISSRGDSVGLAGEGRYYHAAYFNGPYGKAVIPYDSSGILALSHVMNKSYVNYWLDHKSPDPDYSLYRYPAKMYSAAIAGAVAYAMVDSGTKEKEINLARIVANDLMKISFQKGYAWEYFPPTYYGPWIAKLNQAPWIQKDNVNTTYGTNAGDAYLDLYDITGDKEYFQAAKGIADTYLKRQLKNGTWDLYVDPKTGDPTFSKNNIAIPSVIINYLDRLKEDYHVEGLDTAIRKALNWIMANPVKTFNWQGQFEDVGTHKPYEDLTKREACELAIYLFKHNKNGSKNIELAEELLRFSEDQFVVWEKPQLINSDNPFYASENWVTPCVMEQSVYWVPISFSSYILMKTYMSAYNATKRKIYLAKASSIANALTIEQKIHQGNYSIFLTKYPKLEDIGGQWLNCIVYPAKEMIALGNELKKLNN
jgi:maltose/maltodextrin transport system substrate-binding protein